MLTHVRFAGVPRRYLLVAVVIAMIAALIPALATDDGAHAATGDFSLDFVASESSSYDHAVGGGAFDDDTTNVDTVESLQGGDFVCGDIVTYLVEISVDGDGTDDPQTIELDFAFNDSGQPGAEFGDIVGTQINYSPISDLLEDTVEDGMTDDGGSTATLIAENIPTLFAGNTMTGTVEVTDLEDGEVVILRLDVQIFCDPGSSPTGNLQAAIDAARVTQPTGAAGNISVGNQTVNLMGAGDIVSTGTIVIVKDSVPDHETDFAFTTTGGLAPSTFDLDDDSDPTLSNTQTFEDVPFGSYVINENPAAGWGQLGSCVDPTNDSAASGGSATIELAAGETVTCTVTNIALGTLVIRKDTVPDDGADFDFTTTGGGLLPPSFTLDDDADPTLPNVFFNPLAPGTYSVTEAATPGYTTTVACDDPNGNATINGATVTVDVVAFETVDCTWTNTLDQQPQTGTIVIVKDTVPDLPDDFSFTTGGLTPTTFDLDDDADGTLANTQTFSDVPVGTYTVTETADPGFRTSLVCTDPDEGTTVNGAAATIDVDAEETITCTYTNQRLVNIKAIKYSDDDQDGQWDGVGVEDYLAGWSFSLYSGDGTTIFDSGITSGNELNAAYTFAGIYEPGDYVICEDEQAGWINSDPGAGTVADPDGFGRPCKAFTISETHPSTVVNVFFGNYEDGPTTGTIVIIKDTVPDDSRDFFFASPGLVPETFFLDDANPDDNDGVTNTQTFANVEPGTYTIQEVAEGFGGYGISIVCEDPDQGTTTNAGNSVIDLDAGETVTCTYTNTADAVTIDVSKEAEGPDSRTFPTGSDVTFTITVTNGSGGELLDVEIDDPLVPACSTIIGALGAFDTVTYTCTAFGVIDGFTNVITATGLSVNGFSVIDSDESTVVIEDPVPTCTFTVDGQMVVVGLDPLLDRDDILRYQVSRKFGNGYPYLFFGFMFPPDQTFTIGTFPVGNSQILQIVPILQDGSKLDAIICGEVDIEAPDPGDTPSCVLSVVGTEVTVIVDPAGSGAVSYAVSRKFGNGNAYLYLGQTPDDTSTWTLPIGDGQIIQVRPILADGSRLDNVICGEVDVTDDDPPPVDGCAVDLVGGQLQVSIDLDPTAVRYSISRKFGNGHTYLFIGQTSDAVSLWTIPDGSDQIIQVRAIFSDGSRGDQIICGEVDLIAP